MPKNDETNFEERVDPAKLWFRYRRYPYLLAKVAFFGAIAYAIFLILETVEAVIFPVLVSMLIAYLVDPAIDKAEERGVNRTVAILVLILVGSAAGALFIIVLYPTFANSVGTILEKLPQIGELIENRFIPWVEDTFGYGLPPTISETIAEYRGQIQEQIPNVAQRVTGWAGGLLSQTGAIVVAVLNLIMIPIFSFYFLRDFDKMRLSMVQYLPLHGRETIIDRMTKMDTVVGAWFRGQITVAFILAVLYSTGLGTIFGVAGMDVTSGVAVGLLAGLLNIIPYFGIAIGLVLSVLLVLIEWTGPGPLFGVLALFMIVQLLEGYIITPKIVGEAVGLSPVVVIIVLLVGGEMLGLMGVLLAIPIAGVIKVLLPDIIALYRESPFYTGEFRPGGGTPGYASAAVEPSSEARVEVEMQEAREEAENRPVDDPLEADELGAEEPEPEPLAEPTPERARDPEPDPEPEPEPAPEPSPPADDSEDGSSADQPPESDASADDERES